MTIKQAILMALILTPAYMCFGAEVKLAVVMILILVLAYIVFGWVTEDRRERIQYSGRY